MNEKHHQFLSLRHFPARFNTEQTAWILGVSEHDIPILVAAGVLKPLGQPTPNSVKYFFRPSIEELSRDERRMHRLTVMLQEHWRKKNSAPARNSKVEARVGWQDKAGMRVRANPGRSVGKEIRESVRSSESAGGRM